MEHKYDVFISYSRKDTKIVDKICEAFDANGITYFIDRSDIVGGEEFVSVIRSAIEKSNFVLSLCSENSEKSRWVANELMYAESLQKMIYIILLGANTATSSKYKFLLSQSQHQIITLSSFNDSDIGKTIDRISSIFLKYRNNNGNGKVLSKQKTEILETQPSPEQRSFDTVSPKSKISKVIVIGCFIFIIVILLFILSRKSAPSCGTSPYDCNEISPYDLEEEATPKRMSSLTDEDFKQEEATYPFDEIVVDSISIVENSYDSIDIIGKEFYTPEDLSDECKSSRIVTLYQLKTYYNYYNLYFSVILFIVIILSVVLYRKLNKKFNVKIHNRNTKNNLSLLVDGKFETEIKPLEVVCVKRKKGAYVFTLQMKENDDKVVNINYNFGKHNNNEILPIKLDQELNSEFIMYRCFIGGSTSIVNERNAARAVLSILYNQYEKYNFYITAHTFEDFTNKHKIEGHQYKYDEFIRKKANCTIFIICKYVGPKTLNEYKVAVETYECTDGERPSIFVYNDISENEVIHQDSSIIEFRKLVDSNNAYWRDYQNIEMLMLKMKEDISAELSDVLEMRPNLKIKSTKNT